MLIIQALLRCVTLRPVQITVGTNHFGPTLLSHLLMDNLVETAKQTGTARCCFMSSTFEAIAWLNWDDLG